MKYRKREDTKDLPLKPKKITSAVLAGEAEAAIVTFKKMTEMPVNDVLTSCQ